MYAAGGRPSTIGSHHAYTGGSGERAGTQHCRPRPPPTHGALPLPPRLRMSPTDRRAISSSGNRLNGSSSWLAAWGAGRGGGPPSASVATRRAAGSQSIVQERHLYSMSALAHTSCRWAPHQPPHAYPLPRAGPTAAGACLVTAQQQRRHERHRRDCQPHHRARCGFPQAKWKKKEPGKHKAGAQQGQHLRWHMGNPKMAAGMLDRRLHRLRCCVASALLACRRGSEARQYNFT